MTCRDVTITSLTNPPFWIWGRHLESQTCSHTADNDVTKKVYDFVLRNSQNKHTKAKNYLLLTNEGENLKKDWKKTEDRNKKTKNRKVNHQIINQKIWKGQSSQRSSRSTMGKQIWYKPVEPKHFGSDISVRPYRLWGRVRGVPRQPDQGRRNVLFFSCSWSKQYGGWFLDARFSIR